MKYINILLIFIMATITYAKESNTVLEAKLLQNDMSADAVIILENKADLQDVFLSYNKDLVIITIKNAIMLKKQLYPKTTDKRILRTLVHSPVLNRVDYRIRFKNSKFVKPELNEIFVKNNKITVKFFKSQKDMLLFHLQEERNSKKQKIAETKKQQNPKTKETPKTSTKSEKINRKLTKAVTNAATTPKENGKSTQELMASPAPYSFNPTIFLILIFLGAVAFYLRKRNTEISSDGVKILSSKSLGNKKQLILVEANGNKMLLATSENGVQVLSSLDENPYSEEEKPEYTPQKNKFKTKLDEEIDELEKSFFEKRKNPYQLENEEPEVVTHLSKKLRNIKKL